MSTQRRENRSTPATNTCRQGPRNRWQRTSCTASAGASKAPSDRCPSLRRRVSGQAIPSPLAPFGCADAIVGTATPGFPARLATISLQSDHRIVQLVLHVLRLGSLPTRAGIGAKTGTPATHGSSPRHISSLSSLSRLHPTLTGVPAGRRRWAERYDGKGNMYLQHAA